jgi:hypothetical protein
MKKTKIEIDATEAAVIYKSLAAYERELRADKEASPSIIAMSLTSLGRLQDKVAVAYEHTRPIPDRKKGGTQ